jgi:hypothetical protein
VDVSLWFWRVSWTCAARKLDRVVDLPVLPARLVR